MNDQSFIHLDFNKKLGSLMANVYVLINIFVQCVNVKNMTQCVRRFHAEIGMLLPTMFEKIFYPPVD